MYNNNNNRYNNNNNSPQMPMGTVVNGQILTQNGWRPYKKKSGAKEVSGTNSNGKWWGVSAWFANKRSGLVKISAFENEKSTRFENEKGEESIMLLFEVIYPNTGQKVLEISQYKFSTGKAFLSNLGIVISTKSPNGGYCGFLRKNK